MSHTQSMENQVKNQQGVVLTSREAEEYCAYKRQKKIGEIMAAMRCSETLLTANDSAVKACEHATRLHQSAVRMTPSEMVSRGDLFRKSGVKIDCIIGGNGETFTKVKAYEAKRAIRAGANELTLILTPSLIAGSRYHELRKEIRRLRKTAGKIPLKARVEKVYPSATLSRLARICSEQRLNYFSTPYFVGCERIKTDLLGGCQLEVSDVETLEDFKKTAGAGMGRVLTSNIWGIYTEWLAEVERLMEESRCKPSASTSPTAPTTEKAVEAATATQPTNPLESAEKTPKAEPSQGGGQVNSETEYRCRLEGSHLKFS